MSRSMFSYIIGMWGLIVIGGGIIISFIGPHSFSLEPLVNSGAKMLIGLILIFLWIFILLKIKKLIFKKQVIE
jgi:hypothetical protein